MLSKISLERTQDGRKYKMALILAILMLGSFMLLATYPVLSGQFPTFVTAIGALYVAYCAGNVGNKWVTTKNIVDNEPQED